MKRSPLVPFGIIATLGIILIVTFSIYGLDNVKEVAEGDNAPAEETVAANPEDIYKQNCSGCHGQSFEGGAGPTLKGVSGHLTVDQIKETITNGRGIMPPFGGKIPDDKIAELATFISEVK